jgi:predicted DNA-binding protein with PD1-like motif
MVLAATHQMGDVPVSGSPRAKHVSSLEVTVQSRLLDRNGAASYALIFEVGDEVMAGLVAFAKEQQLEASDFTALGAFSSALLGFFDVEEKDYRKIPVDEQVEVLTLVGNITLDQGEPKVHAHTVLGCADGATRGGHLLEGYVRPTLELVLTESPVQLRRRYDAETGLALIRL